MNRDTVTLPISILLWAAMIAIAVLVRPPLPVDETRYLAVAWEMWLRGDWLVPHLNGEPYHHKPPLMFWLINLTWTFFGVSSEAARLIAPLFSILTLWATTALARALWPERSLVAGLTPLILVGGLFWAIFSTLTMFDMMLSAFTALALWGALIAWRTGSDTGFVIFAVATGLGVLTKGPVIVVHVLPALLLAPLWGPMLGNIVNSRQPRGGWKKWYIASFLAVLGAAAIGLAWAIPAAISGGDDFAYAIFWGQSAGRVVDSFAHARPWWFYLAVLPAMALPWLIWSRFWAGLWGEAKQKSNIGPYAFLVCWVGPALAVFSVISGKNPHYMLPEYSALALILAAALARSVPVDGDNPTTKAPWYDRLPYVFLAFAGIVVFAAQFLNMVRDKPAWWSDPIEGSWGLVIAGLAIVAFLLASNRVARRVLITASLTAAFVITLHVALTPMLHTMLDLRPLAKQLSDWQQAGRGLAHFGKYHGKFQFLGRLEQPMTVIGVEPNDVESFMADNPNGIIVSYHRFVPTEAEPVQVYPFRSYFITVWNVADVAHDPLIVGRKGEHEVPTLEPTEAQPEVVPEITPEPEVNDQPENNLPESTPESASGT